MISNKTAKDRFNRFLNTTIYEIEGFYRLSDRVSWAVLVCNGSHRVRIGCRGNFEYRLPPSQLFCER